MIPWYWLVIFASLILAVCRIIKKKALFKEHALEFAVTNSTILAVYAFILLAFVKSWPSALTLVFVYALSVLWCAGSLHHGKAVRHMELSIVEPMTNISPLFLLVISYIFLGEVITGIQFVGILLMLAGAYVLEINHATDSHKLDLARPFKEFLKSKYLHYLVFSLVAFSFVALIEKKLLQSAVTPLTLFIFVRLFVAFNFIVLEWYRYGSTNLKKALKTQTPLVFLHSTLQTIGHLIFYYTFALPGTLISLIIPLKRSTNLFTVILAGKLFHDKHIVTRLVACAITIVGAYCILV